MTASKGVRSASTRDRILDAAEPLFANQGYDGVSLRTLASAADAQLALLHYHFGTKLDLYRAVWARRVEQTRLHDDPRPAAGQEGETLELRVRQLVGRFFEPMIRLRQVEAFRPFLKIVAQEIPDPKQRERGLVEEFLGPQASLFLAALEELLPAIPKVQAAVGLRIMIGAVQALVLDAETTLRLSAQGSNSTELDAAVEPIIAFVVAGWLEIGQRSGRLQSSGDAHGAP